MRREAKKLLFDIQEACLRLERFADGKSFEHYEQDELLRAGVERQFEIIVCCVAGARQKRFLTPFLLAGLTSGAVKG